MKINVTSLSYFSDCRRQWWLGESYSPKKPQSAYWLGSLVHDALETYYKTNHDIDKALKSAEGFIKKSFDEMPSGVWEAYGQEMQELADLALGMISNYQVYDSQNPIEGKVKAIESRVAVPLMVWRGQQVQLVGRIDLIIERDGLWVVDHKTSSSEMDLRGLDVDEQLTAYAYLVWKTYNVVPRGVIYNVLMKQLPTDPVVLKSGGLSVAKDQKTVYDLYLSKINELGLPREDYQTYLDYLASLGWTKFFKRDGASRNVHELESFEQRAIRKGEDILSIREDPVKNAYPSPSTLKCSWCGFLGVCKAMEDGGDYQAILDSGFKLNPY